MQYVPHAPPGYHGTDIYFYSRVAIVHMAIAVALVCDIAILPWCASVCFREVITNRHSDRWLCCN